MSNQEKDVQVKIEFRLYLGSGVFQSFNKRSDAIQRGKEQIQHNPQNNYFVIQQIETHTWPAERFGRDELKGKEK